jgi:hypothetical protein
VPMRLPLYIHVVHPQMYWGEYNAGPRLPPIHNLELRVIMYSALLACLRQCLSSVEQFHMRLPKDPFLSQPPGTQLPWRSSKVLTPVPLPVFLQMSEHVTGHSWELNLPHSRPGKERETTLIYYRCTANPFSTICHTTFCMWPCSQSHNLRHTSSRTSKLAPHEST